VAAASPPLLPVPCRSAEAVRRAVEQALAGRISTGFQQFARADFEYLPSGIGELDGVSGGLPRGAMSEFCGPASSGRTTAMLAALAHATSAGEACCLVDADDSFDPQSGFAAGVKLEQLLWARCGAGSGRTLRSAEENLFQQQNRGRFAALEQVLRVTDLVLQGGGFGLVALDLGDVAPQLVRRIPLTSWFRFRRAVEKTRTVLLVLEQEPHAGTCASLILQFSRNRRRDADPAVITHAQLLYGIEVRAEVLRLPGRKQPQKAGAHFRATSQWKADEALPLNVA
jgi:recombination protein RecA